LVRESLWGFQIIVAIHIPGLALSAGTVVWFDLRLLGLAMTRNRISDVYRRLLPWTAAGFVVMFSTGGLLFTGFAVAASGNIYFRAKMLAILCAGLNALAYHGLTERRLAEWDDARRPPRAARLAGLASIFLWAVVILAGRMISYTMFQRGPHRVYHEVTATRIDEALVRRERTVRGAIAGMSGRGVRPPNGSNTQGVLTGPTSSPEVIELIGDRTRLASLAVPERAP
jgi:hypothetical protein